MADNLNIEDAISIAWTNAPDAMQVIVDEMKLCREVKFGSVREAKKRGVGADWILGEMLAYDEMLVNLEQPKKMSEASAPIRV